MVVIRQCLRDRFWP